jgi:DNA invertase Pin-like site-specific DNA recombinase
VSAPSTRVRYMDWISTKSAFTRRAVAYYRHSAQDRQENSVEIQQDQVRQFAEEHGIEIVREFADRGKSGLSTDGRDAFNDMIQEYVQGEKEDFDLVLALDVSRWGRFQDTDLSAYFTGLCAKHGKEVVFTTIGFGKKNDLLHGLHLSIERYRAASYSRELSMKVFKGCAKIASQGFRAGGMPPYGFHRLLLDEQRNPVQILERGQRKSIQNQRVTLTPGSPDEIAVIKRIFRSFVQRKKSPQHIATTLNANHIPSPGGCRWSPSCVHAILTNELYVGTMIYNKTTQRLKSRSRHNPHDEWIRAEDAFPAIVDRKLFDSAQAILKATEEAHRIKYSNEDMLSRLRSMHEQYGTVRRSLITATPGMVSPATYAHRFSSLFESYQGLFSEVIEDRRARVVKDLKERVTDTQEYGDFVVLHNYVSIRILPVVQFPQGYEAGWSFTPDPRPEIDITLGVPLTNGGKYDVLGYLFFPRLMLGGREVRIATTTAEKLHLHAYTLSQALETLIGMEVIS